MQNYPDTPRVCLIEGDGIGPEITAATVDIVKAAGGKIDWVPVLAGGKAISELRDPLPTKTLEQIEKVGLALKGPLATPIGEGFRSINVAMRQHFDLFANLRPAKTIPGVPSRYEAVDVVVVRENTEGMYSGIEHYVGRGRSAAETIGVITREGSSRIVEYAFAYAKQFGRKRITLVHKANILKATNGLFLNVGKEIAEKYPEIEFDDCIVDAAAMRLVTRPESFDVIVTTNLFGDILSDLTAGLVGGLGVAPAANLGDSGVSIFEAVHGTAPDIAGKGVANPTALTLSAALLLDHVGQAAAAERIRRGVWSALANPKTRTGDLGGSANTAQFADATKKNME